MTLLRKIENICILNNIIFHYGSKSHLNLIDSNGALEPDKTHLLLFPIREGKKNRSDNSRVCNGSFFFVRPDNFQQSYYNETSQNENESKLVAKIEPLQIELDLIEEKLQACQNLDLINLDRVDIIDFLDGNFTGWHVTFQIKNYE